MNDLDFITPEHVANTLAKLAALGKAYQEVGLYREAMNCAVRILQLCGMRVKDDLPWPAPAAWPNN